MQGTPGEVGAGLHDADKGMFLSMPVPVQIFNAVEGTGECPLTVSEGRKWLGDVVCECPEKRSSTQILQA